MIAFIVGIAGPLLAALRPFIPYIIAAAAALGALWWANSDGKKSAMQAIQIEQAQQVEKANNEGNKAAAAAAVDGAAKRLRGDEF
jgi:hypothetical protein